MVKNMSDNWNPFSAQKFLGRLSFIRLPFIIVVKWKEIWVKNLYHGWINFFVANELLNLIKHFSTGCRVSSDFELQWEIVISHGNKIQLRLLRVYWKLEIGIWKSCRIDKYYDENCEWFNLFALTFFVSRKLWKYK